MSDPKKYVGSNRLTEIFGYIKDVLPKVATETEVGLVKVDGESTMIDEDGTLHSSGTIDFLKVQDGEVCAVYTSANSEYPEDTLYTQRVGLYPED